MPQLLGYSRAESPLSATAVRLACAQACAHSVQLSVAAGAAVTGTLGGCTAYM